MTYEKEDFLSPDDYDNAMSLIKALSKINLKEYTLNHIYDGILKEPEFIFSGKEFLLKTKEYSTILIGCTFCPETDKIQTPKKCQMDSLRITPQ